MHFGLHFTFQLPRPWAESAERQLYLDALEQVQLADRLGFGYAWVVEQHFLEEFSHSSAPEIFLSAASQLTTRIRLGHGIALMPPGYSHPARVAERISALDLVSGGRVEFGIGDSKSRMELEGFGIDATQRRAMTLEAAEQVANMMTLQPYPGFDGEYFSMPARNVLPKPLQKPHPPLWIACSDDETIHLAAKLGIGALAHPFFDADDAQRVVDDYDETFKRECVPIGHSVNPNVAMMDPLYCHENETVAVAEGMEAHGFFTYAARHYYSFGRHRPGFTNLSDNLVKVRRELGGDIPLRGSHAVGTPEQLAERMRDIEGAGVDQVVLVHHAGGLTNAQTCESLKLFADNVMPEFLRRHEEHQQRKHDELAPYVEAAFKRKERLPAAEAENTAVCDAYGLSRPDVELAILDEVPASTREIIMELQQLKNIALTLDT
jgi:alkanesulfonate monooxygenase SsuD/methylene tetrahydromethanopterin reductase-like flavin-dependent oxidoreductase (luciferase family)